MKFKTAAIIFLIFCLIIVYLLLLDKISNFVAGILFAFGLLLTGLLSKGLRKK